jgi:cell division protein YceG involved in septum cleavage
MIKMFAFFIIVLLFYIFHFILFKSCFIFLFSASVSFEVGSMHNIREQANVEVITKQLYNEDATRTPTQYGVLDRRMVCNI